jgi:hypothetical protein
MLIASFQYEPTASSLRASWEGLFQESDGGKIQSFVVSCSISFIDSVRLVRRDVENDYYILFERCLLSRMTFFSRVGR